MAQRIANPRERLLYEMAEKKAKELQGSSTSEAIKAIKIQSYDEYVESMDSSGLPKTGTQYWLGSPQPTSAALGGNSSTKLESGRKYAASQWKKMVYASGGVGVGVSSRFYHSSGIDPDSKPDSPQAIGFLNQRQFEDLQSKGVPLGEVEKFRNFQEGANFFQNNIGDLFHGTSIAGGHIGDVPHFLGQGSAPNQGALYLSPSSVFAGGYAGSTMSWTQGTGGHLYKGSIDFGQQNIFNPANYAHIAKLKEHLLTQDYTDDEWLAIEKDAKGSPTSPRPAFSTLSKEERRSTLSGPVDRIMRDIESFSWRALQSGGNGATVTIPDGQQGAGQFRSALRINESIKDLGFTGWIEEEGGVFNMALYDTGKVGEKTNIPNFKFAEKRIINPEVALDAGFSGVTGQENYLDDSKFEPNPEHLRRIIPGETRGGQNVGPQRINEKTPNLEDFISDTKWHPTGSASAYDVIGQEYYHQWGENFQWQRGALSPKEREVMLDFKNPEFTRLADDLVQDMQRLSANSGTGANITSPTADPEIDSKAGSAIDPSSPGTPGGPQPPPAGSAIDSAIDSIDSGELGQADSASTGSAIDSNGKSAAGDVDPPPGIRSAADEIAQKSLPSSAEGGKGVDGPKASSSSDMAIAKGGNTAEGKSADAGSKAQGESSSRAGAAAGEKEAKAASGGKGGAKADSAPGASKVEEKVKELTEEQREKYRRQMLKAQAIIDDPGVTEGQRTAARNLINKLSNKLAMSPGDPAAASSGGGPSKPSSGAAHSAGAAAGSSGGGGQPPPRPPRPPGGGNASGNTGNAGSRAAGAGGAGGAGGGPPPPPPPPRNPPGAGGGGPNPPGGNGRPPGTPPGGPPGGGGSPGGGPPGGGGGPGGPHWNRAPGGTASGAHAAAGGAGGAKAAGANAARKPLNIKGGIGNAYGNIRSAFSNFFKGGGGPRGPRGGFGTVAGAAAAAGRPGTRTSSIIKAWAFNSSLLEREMDLTTRGFVAGLGSIVNDLGLNRRESAYGTNGKASAYIDTFFGTTVRGGKGFAHPSMEVSSSGTRTGRVVWSTKATAQEALEGWSTHIDDAVTHSSGVMRGMNRMRQFMFNLFGGKTSTVNRTIARLGGVGTLVAPGFMGFSAVSDFRDGYRHGGIAGGLVGAVKGVATGWIVNKMMATALLNPAAAIITAAALGATAYTAYKIFDVRNKGSEYLKMGRMQGMSWNKGPSMGMNSAMANTIKHRSIMGMENSRLNASRSMGNESYMQSAPKSRYANSTAIHSNSSLLSLANS